MRHRFAASIVQQALIEDYSETFDEQGRKYLDRLRFNAQKMEFVNRRYVKTSRVYPGKNECFKNEPD
ncbi:MAG: hypothetical protein IPG53_21545 [Ignavibacteriales bacterium]|nr:hypothetical protein [Ignavibacteriales bacterium]